MYFQTADLLQKRGHKVTFFSANDEKNLPQKHFVSFKDPLNLGFWEQLLAIPRFFFSLETVKKLERLIDLERPDLAHLHIFYGRLTSAVLYVLHKHSIPTAMTLHDYKMICPAYSCLDPNGKICELCSNGKYWNCIWKKCNKKNLAFSAIQAFESWFRDIFFPYEKLIDCFIMPSQFSLKKHLNKNPLLLGKSKQIYNCVNLSEFSPNNGHDGSFLFFGRLSREKGLMTLTDAFQAVQEATLNIVGEGPLKQTLLEEIEKKQIKNTRLLGFKQGEELHSLIRNSKFVILPAECYENNPLSIIEAFASGKPVIGSGVGGIPELIKEGQNGFIFQMGKSEDLAEKIRRACKMSQEEYSLFSMNSRRTAEKMFSAEEHYNKLLEAYSAAIGK